MAIEPPFPPSEKPRVKFFGVGSGGIAILNSLSSQPWAAGACVALHTSAKVLTACQAPRRVLLGQKQIFGLGCGGDPALGRAIGEDERAMLAHLCENVDLAFILAGFGGGTGTSVAISLAQTAREARTLVIAVVAMPFAFEGSRRQQQARDGLAELKQVADVVMVLPNQKCARLLTEKAGLSDVFKLTNDMAADAIRSVAQMVTHPGLINLDFAYLYSMLRGKDSESAFAVGRGAGEHRVQQALDMILNSPLLDNGKALADAAHVVVSIASGSDLTLVEIDSLMQQLERRTGKADVVVGAAIDPALQGQLEITVIASSNGAAEVSDGSNALVVRSITPAAPSLSPEISSTFFGEQASVNRAPSRFAAPPPELTAEETERLYKTQVKRRGGKASSAAARMRQGTLPLEIISRGRFDKTDPTIHQGENLDVPTFVRRGMVFN